MLIQYGTTNNFIVSYDSTFTGGAQPNGPALAQGVLDYCEYDLVRLSQLFGFSLAPPWNLPISVNLVPGAGGAQNNLANAISLYCDASTNPLQLPAIVVAEAAEIFMMVQTAPGSLAAWWYPTWSCGEALSRICAQILYPQYAFLWKTGDSWLAAGRPNWVDNVDQTDSNFVSTGCGTLFLSYLAYQKNFRWPDIVQAAPRNLHTLTETAGNLGLANAWNDFSQAAATYFPVTLPSQPTGFGQPAQQTDDPFPVGSLPAQLPVLYMRHNLADDGTTHSGSLSDSPDIILKNAPVANPQATYSTAGSIASGSESDAGVITGQENYVYLRVWNRGVAANNVFATVYWSPPTTLVSPNLWNRIGSAYFPDVPAGQAVQVSSPGITWPADQLPGPGHYCFVATVGSAYAPAPNAGSFTSFDDFVNYIYANNNITWRNFNVVSLRPIKIHPHWGKYRPLRFLLTGAWDKSREFELEIVARLPNGSHLAMEVPQWVGRAFKATPTKMEEVLDKETDPDFERRVRIQLPLKDMHGRARIVLPAGTSAACHMLVEVPEERHTGHHSVMIRQLYEGREVGRVTWSIVGEIGNG